MSLKSVNLPEGMTILSNDVFNGCFSLTSVKLPSTLQTIGGQAFMGCSRLTEISIPKDIVTIETYTFANYTNLAKVYFLGHIENLNQSCFNNCKDDIVFSYVGSIAEWKLVKKNLIWCTAKNKLIKCSDGDVNS